MIATWAIAVLLGGCVRTPPPPVVYSVWPSTPLYNGEPHVLAIYGDNFFPQVELDATRRGVADVDRQFTVVLVGEDGDELELDGSATDYHTIETVVPERLDVGSYAVRVVSPTGEAGESDGPLVTITDSEIDRIAVTTDDVHYRVGDPATISFRLVDHQGEDVYLDADQDIRVAVTVESEDTLEGDLANGSLDDAVLDAEAMRIEGALDEFGSGSVFLTLDKPAFVTVHVEPLEAGSDIGEGAAMLEWAPGAVVGLRIELPEDTYTARAGTPFEVVVTPYDDEGNDIVEDGDEPVDVLLRDECGIYVGSADRIYVRETFEVTVTELLPDTCDSDRIVNAFDDLTVVSDDTFTVVPGPVDHLDVSVVAGAGSEDIVAGQIYHAFIRAEDAWHNEVADWSGTISEVRDSSDGVSSYLCNAASVVACDLTSIRAGETTLMVEATDGTTGVSPPFTIRPATATRIEVTADAATYEAGTAGPVTVTVYDAWDNVVDAADFGASAFTITDATGSIACVPAATTGPAQFDCAFYISKVGNTLTATLDTGASVLTDTSDGFDVVNGPLSRVTITPDVGTITAGTKAQFTFRGYDAWDNEYVTTSSPPVLDLTDTNGGTVTPTTLTLSGVVVQDLTFTKAGSTQVVASESGTERGRSVHLNVQPGATNGLSLAVADPWIDLGEALTVTVRSVDAYGNPTEEDGSGTLTASSGAAADVSFALSGGVGSATLNYTDVASDDRVVASLGGWSGSYEGVVVSERCTPGPTADVVFGGASDYALACYDETLGEAQIVGDLSGSASSTPLSLYGLRLVGGDAHLATTSTLTVLAVETGIFDLEALVVDADGCGDVASARAYVGADDGGVVGPIDVSFDDTAIEPGAGYSSVADTTTVVTVDALTCTGDPADGVGVYLRADRGEITGATASGQGLEVGLVGGTGSAVLDVFDFFADGTATVHAWAPTGAAYGSASIDVVGDSQNPIVLEQSPSGADSGSYDAIDVVFSEPMLASTLTVSQFTVSDGTTTAVIDTVTTSDNEAVTLELDGAIDASSGPWTVTVRQAVRDAAGNKLAGTWQVGTAADYTGRFGGSTDTADPVTVCTPDRATFRPDGDPGAGDEADEVTIAVQSATQPTWWVIDVTDADGELVDREFVAPRASTDAWVWDGRALDERIVDNGTYTVAIDSEDAYGNRGGACSTTVTVDNPNGE